MAEFWGKSAQHIIILLDKLMTYKVVDGASIVNWLFDHERVNSFHSYVWEVSEYQAKGREEEEEERREDDTIDL